MGNQRRFVAMAAVLAFLPFLSGCLGGGMERPGPPPGFHELYERSFAQAQERFDAGAYREARLFWGSLLSSCRQDMSDEQVAAVEACMARAAAYARQEAELREAEGGDPSRNAGMAEAERLVDEAEQGLEGDCPEAATAAFEAAIAVVDRLPPTPREPGRRLLRARCVLGLGRLDEAAKLTDALGRDFPGCPDVPVLEASIHEAAGRHEARVEALARALALGDDAEIHDEMARALVAVGDPVRREEALRHGELAVGTSEDAADALGEVFADAQATERLRAAARANAIREAQRNFVDATDLSALQASAVAGDEVRSSSGTRAVRTYGLADRTAATGRSRSGSASSSGGISMRSAPRRSSYPSVLGRTSKLKTGGSYATPVVRRGGG